MEPSSSSSAQGQGPQALRMTSRWYSTLRPLLLDLVGDYAGQELFFIDGDSLCLHVFQDKRISIQDGPEVVHAIYVLERFLHNLKKRGCNFHVVFFENHKFLCFNHNHVEPDRAWRYLLVREAFVRHLQQNLSDESAVQLRVFEGAHDPGFKRYLEDEKPYFCMAHDAIVGTKGHELQNTMQTGFLWFIMKHGYNVAMIDRVEFKDSKVITLVAEGRHLDSFSDGFEQQYHHEVAMAFSILEEKYNMIGPNETIELCSAVDEFIKTPREHITTAVLSVMAEDDEETLNLLTQFGFAFLRHTVLLSSLSLEERCVAGVSFEDSQAKAVNIDKFFNTVCRYLAIFLSSSSSLRALKDFYPEEEFEVCDIVDGRLFRLCVANPSFGEAEAGEAERLATALTIQTRLRLPPPEEKLLVSTEIKKTQIQPIRTVVLPFQHRAFDGHLTVIKLEIDSNDTFTHMGLHRLAEERTHWHSQKLLKGSFIKLNKWQHRADQIYHSQMQRYAASITGRLGQSLDPELIIVGDKSGKGKQANVSKSSGEPSQVLIEDYPVSSNIPVSKKNEKAKKGKPGSQQAGMKKADLIRSANSKAKTEKTEAKIVLVWGRYLEELIATLDKAKTKSEYEEFAIATLTRINDFQKTKMKSEAGGYIFLETRLYRLKILINLWGEACRGKQKESSQDLAALIFDEARHIFASSALSKKIFEVVSTVWTNMGFGSLPFCAPVTGKERLSDQLIPALRPEMKISKPPIEFQLAHSGPYMDRSFGSAPDHRVKFHPDEWQRDVLDLIDENKSVFVVAPTSAGKTFISFYAMEKVLKGSNDGVLVYVAPTKALVNQIAAEVVARFDKSYPHAGQTVWAIHTRDYRINRPDHCQILITVPHILQIMLLAPANANKWAPRVKRIIFDEIHSIGQAEDGVIWEQLLLLAPCPIIALSATVGNPGEFRDWLAETQKAVGYDLEMVEHQHRYSDLRKFIYEPPSNLNFRGLGAKRHFEELNEENGFMPLNPISTLIDTKHRGIPRDLSLEPRDCLELYQVMKKHQTGQFNIGTRLDPTKWFQGIVKKIEVVKWEAALKRELESWMADPNSPFNLVIHELSHKHEENNNIDGSSGGEQIPGRQSPTSQISEDDAHDNDPNIQETTLSLLSHLHDKNALPAILFTFDRTMVEQTAITVLRQLENAEKEWKRTNPEFLKEQELYKQYLKTENDKQRSKRDTQSSKKDKKGKSKDDDVYSKKEAKLEEERTHETSKWAFYDPNAPHEKFLFVGKVGHDVEEDFKFLEKSSIPQSFIACLRRGIGIHHAGLSRRLREAVETLFRMGYLQVVIATGTLALGINMPCKTVAFIGDSAYLTALQYRQCAGRAGRRGFDLFGNVIFHGLTKAKVDRLISSRLPSLNGHFPISTSLVLRLFSLLDGSQESPYSNQAVNQLLSQPRLFMGGQSFKEQVLHHLRFSIEYLRRQHLIDGKGRAINLAGLVGHLYYTGNSAFAFHALLKEGVFHAICKDVYRKPAKTSLMLMLVLSHIFNRRQLKSPKDIGPIREEIIRRSPSEVYLQPLPQIARDALVKHNKETLEVFTGYAATFAQEYCRDIPDNTLPFTHKTVGSQPANSPDAKVHARSTFYRLSGHDDKFESASDLADSARNGVFLESNAIPMMDVESSYYNAYLLDFFKHGSEQPLVVANGLRANDVWFMLNDFSMILATIVTSFLNFLSEKEQKDSAAEDILDSLAFEEGEQILEATDDDTVQSFEAGDEVDEEDIDLSTVHHAAVADPDEMLKVLKAFANLKESFDTKLQAIAATKKPIKKRKNTKPKLTKI